VVVDKDAGILTIPTADQRGESVAENLAEIYRRRGFKSPEVSAVHRIDRYTSGLVAFARHGAARVALRREFAACRPERVYAAVIEGRPPAGAGRLEHRLVENAQSLKVAVTAAPREGRRATCRYRLVEAFAHAALLEVTLETGRRNQIRVQFAAEGHALVGDLAYGRPSAWIDRTALHAHRLAFDAPSGKRLSFESAPPKDFRELLRALRRGVAPQAEPALPEPSPRPTRPRAAGRRYR
jgi:23S rRNA pseudouridine1911/1915/1917 synthase